MYIRDLFRITKFYVYTNNIKDNIVQIIFHTKDKADIILLANHFDLYYASSSNNIEVNTMYIDTYYVTINITISSFDNYFLPYFNEKLRNKYYKMVHPEFLQNPVDKPSQSDIPVVPDEKMLDISPPKDYDFEDLCRYFNNTKQLYSDEENKIYQDITNGMSLCSNINYMCKNIITKKKNITEPMIRSLKRDFDFIYEALQSYIKYFNIGSAIGNTTESNPTSTPMDNS